MLPILRARRALLAAGLLLAGAAFALPALLPEEALEAQSVGAGAAPAFQAPLLALLLVGTSSALVVALAVSPARGR